MILTEAQKKQLKSELSPAIEKVVMEAAHNLSANFFEKAELFIEEGGELINYKEIQDTLMKSVDELFARGTIMPATTEISGVVWSVDDTEIFNPEFISE
ncbi:hypothetical protein [Lactococcus lactis]|uniref:hypothetical protein n=1 Tax=Lactococcus lactis TaxID=1358 RepID=UPI002026B548|nr:hypothetical protein [Lactococcus lactis]MCL9640831.1 hypothetical protein [Lactococcus lactis]